MVGLSKSQIILGRRCIKALWLKRNKPELAGEISAGERMTLEQGREIGELARERYPNGVLISAGPDEIDKAIGETADAIERGATVIFEAAFFHDGVIARPDIITRAKPSAPWTLIEVKSSSDPKKEQIEDVSIESWVMNSAGQRVGPCFLMTLNGDYVREGAVDVEKLFALHEQTEKVRTLVKEIPALVQKLREGLAVKTAPAMSLGKICVDPHECEFKAHCWAQVPKFSVLELGGARWPLREKLWGEGVKTIASIPRGTKLAENLVATVEAARAKKITIDKAAIAKHLAELRSPLYFLDFETLGPAVPPYDGLSPYAKLPFQVSVHIEDAPGGAVRHAEFLGDGRGDPRRALAEMLIATIGDKGSVIAYSKSFEAGCLEQLAVVFAPGAEKLYSIRDRLWDLADPFKKGDYLDPAFGGSWSIKKVLPALVPGMSYEGMAVGDGVAAQAAFTDIMSGRLAPERARMLSEELRRYCAQDTLAMVKILEVLRKSC